MVIIEGEYLRADAVFRRWVGQEGLEPEAGRYHLYVALACPWSHRAVIVRRLKGLEDAIGISYVHPFRDERGWAFPAGATSTTSTASASSSEAYKATDADYDDRVSVPVLWDKKTGTIVNNESAEIIRMFDSAFDELASARASTSTPSRCATRSTRSTSGSTRTFNNGVYRAGFATHPAGLRGGLRRACSTR